MIVFPAPPQAETPSARVTPFNESDKETDPYIKAPLAAHVLMVAVPEQA